MKALTMEQMVGIEGGLEICGFAIPLAIAGIVVAIVTTGIALSAPAIGVGMVAFWMITKWISIAGGVATLAACLSS